MEPIIIIIRLMDLVCGSVFFILAVLALASMVVPFLHRLSLHGKSRTLFFSHKSPSSRNTFRVHKSRFVHFYITGLVVSLRLFYISIANYSPIHHSKLGLIAIPILPFSLLILHLLRRAYECVFLHVWSDTGYMHVCGYLLGLFHYLMIPFVFTKAIELHKDSFNNQNQANTCPLKLVTSAYIFTTCGNFSFLHAFKGMDILTWFGIALNILGQVQQNAHHAILAHGRSHLDPTAKSQYVIPTGKMFHWISCPHYLAEIIIYLSFVVLLREEPGLSLPIVPIERHRFLDLFNMFGFSNKNPFLQWTLRLLILMYRNKTLALFLWVLINLGLSSRINHNYYLVCFKSAYPSSRKRLIPFIW